MWRSCSKAVSASRRSQRCSYCTADSSWEQDGHAGVSGKRHQDKDICKHWEINDKVLDLSLFAICDLGAAAKSRFQSGHHQQLGKPQSVRSRKGWRLTKRDTLSRLSRMVWAEGKQNRQRCGCGCNSAAGCSSFALTQRQRVKSLDLTRVGQAVNYSEVTRYWDSRIA